MYQIDVTNSFASALFTTSNDLCYWTGNKSKINQQICKLNGFCEDDRFYIDNFYR